MGAEAVLTDVKGYSDKDNTWEPISSFKSCLSMLSKFSGNVTPDDQNLHKKQKKLS